MLAGAAEATLQLTHAQYETIVAHCFDKFPDKTCGLLKKPLKPASTTGTNEVTTAYPYENADQSARTYTVDPRDYLRTIRDTKSRDDEIIDIWHSHTHNNAYPSPTNVH